MPLVVFWVKRLDKSNWLPDSVEIEYCSNNFLLFKYRLGVVRAHQRRRELLLHWLPALVWPVRKRLARISTDFNSSLPGSKQLRIAHMLRQFVLCIWGVRGLLDG